MKRFLLLFVLLLNPIFVFANLAISPVKIEFNQRDRISSVMLKNVTQELQNFQVKILKIVEDENGEIKHEDTMDLMATPIMTSIGPDKNQIIRIAVLDHSLERKSEKRYVLSVKTLPLGPITTGVGVGFLIQYMIPIHI